MKHYRLIENNKPKVWGSTMIDDKKKEEEEEVKRIKENFLSSR